MLRDQAAPLETLLRTPRAVVSLVCLIPIIAIPLEAPSRFLAIGVTVSPDWASAALMAAFLTWLYVLYDACISRAGASRKLGSCVFLAAACAYAALWPLSCALFHWQGEPPGALLVIEGGLTASAALLTLGAIGFAAEAMVKAEIAIGKENEWNPFLPLFVIVVGIWFIHHRIQDILAQPRTRAT